MKKLLSMILILIVAMGLVPSTYAEASNTVFEITSLSIGPSDQDYCAVVGVKNITSVPQTGVLVVASYSSEGKFLDFTYTDISFLANIMDYVVLKYNSPPSNFQKVFIWDGFGTFTPLANSFSMQFPDSKEVNGNRYIRQLALDNNEQFHTNNPYIKFGLVDYKFANSVDIYVNGALYTTIKAEADADTVLTTAQARLDAILSQAQGKVKLVKGDPDCFDFTEIHATCYQVAQVSTVSVNNFSTKVSFRNIKGCIDSNSEIANCDYILIERDAVASGDVIINVTRNGEPSDISSIRGDIIAYAVDFKNETDLVNPKRIDIVAISDTSISGTVTAIQENSPYTSYDNVYTIGGINYTMVEYDLFSSLIKVGNLLDITPDPFGRIYSAELNSSVSRYAIALKENADDTISLLLTDGTVKSYKLKAGVSLASSIFNEKDPAKRVVEYKLQNSTGYIAYINPVTGKSYFDEEYMLPSGRLAGSKITDSTPIIYAPEKLFTDVSIAKNASNYEFLSKEDLTVDTAYNVTMFTEGTNVNLVIITKFGTAFNTSSRFAVVTSGVFTALTEEGDRVDSIDVFYEGEEQSLMLFPGICKKYGLDMGDAFFFTTDSDGLVDAVYKVFDKNDNFISLPDAIANKELIDDPSITANDIAKVQEYLMDTDSGVWGYDIWESRCDIILAEGIVAYVEDGYISFATEKQIDSGSLNAANYINSDANGIIDYDYSDDCVAYIYDSASEEKEQYRYDIKDPSSIKASNFTRFEDPRDYTQLANKDGYEMADYAHNALALIVDGEIVEIYVIER